MKYDFNDAKRILTRTPGVLKPLLVNVPDDFLLNNEGGESWCPFDVVGHLIHAEKTLWIVRSKMILDHGESQTFTPFDRFAQFKNSLGKDISDLVDEFESLRTRSLRELEELRLVETDLKKTGVHPRFGRVSLEQLLSTWVVHDLSHLSQITRVMAKQYKDAVGPWREYIRLLSW